MPPSPPSAALSSLAAKFAFKPSEAAKMPAAAATAVTAVSAVTGGTSSPSRTTSKRRLSGSASPVRSSPRRSAAVSGGPPSTNIDLKGKARHISSTATATAADTTTTTDTGKGKGKKSTSTSVNLQEDLNDLDDGLDWELSDSEIAAVSDELLNSSAHKKIKLDKSALANANANVASSSPVKSFKEVASTSAKNVNTSKNSNTKKKDASSTAVSQPKDERNIPAADASEMPNEAAKEFIDSLSDKATEGKGGPLSQRQLLELEGRTMDPSWLTPLQKEMKKSYFLELKRFLWTEGVKTAPEISKNIFPPAGEIYSWSRFTPLDKVRVVILGQDPYHNNGQAHGLAFSVRSNVAVPPSLRNIYKEVKNDYPDFQIPKHGYLGSWARQGVLMLNTSLSVRAHQANSHSGKGWEQFTDSILKTITSRPGPGVVFLAWGNPAQKRTASIVGSTASSSSSSSGVAGMFSKAKGNNTKEKHLVLKSVHPSPLSASRGFFGNGHFKKANEWLKENYGEDGMINWCTLDPEEGSRR